MRRPRERGSALLLVPAGVLVLVTLAAIAVDAAVVFLAERELGNASAAAANDAAAAALADAPFYTTGEIVIDASRAGAVAAESVAARVPRGLELTGPPAVEVAGRQVCVTVEARVRRIFARAIPGVAHEAVVRARSTATVAGDTETGVPARMLC